MHVEEKGVSQSDEEVIKLSQKFRDQRHRKAKTVNVESEGMLQTVKDQGNRKTQRKVNKGKHDWLASKSKEFRLEWNLLITYMRELIKMTL